jgi:Fe-S cluster assembly protein SufD
LVEEFSRRRGEPDWLLASRLAAWQHYEALPKPTTRDEGWRRMDLSELDIERLVAPAEGEKPPRQPLPQAWGRGPEASDDGERSGWLVLRNGKIERLILCAEAAERGVQLSSLSEAIKQQPGLVRPRLADFDPLRETKFSALSAALWEEGAFLHVPTGVALEAPFEIVHWGSGPDPAFSRTLVVAGEASSAAFIESYRSPLDREESLASDIVDLVVGPAAQLNYVRLDERNEETWSFNHLRSSQARDSKLTWLLVGLGSRLSRTELDCELDGQGSEADLIGLVFGQNQQHFDFQTLQNHLGDDSRSDLLLKVALRDRASSNFTGLIRVDKQALRTASNQENRNLLLSGAAKADSDPKLEILNSDVLRCGHGATVGPVDPELMFYLMTRGLRPDQAERLILEGFFEPLLARIPLESVRKRLWRAIELRVKSEDGEMEGRG